MESLQGSVCVTLPVVWSHSGASVFGVTGVTPQQVFVVIPELEKVFGVTLDPLFGVTPEQVFGVTHKQVFGITPELE